MSSGHTISLSPAALELIQRFDRPQQFMPAVKAAMDTENQLSIAHISSVRMRGNDGKPFPPEQHILGIRTGLLYKSIRAAKATGSGARAESSIGTNVRYAGAHEFGFSGEVQVSGHARKQFKELEFLAAPKKSKLPAFKVDKRGNATDWVADAALYAERKTVTRRVRVGDIQVGSYKRKMNIPARAPITTGVEDRLTNYGAAISQAIVDAWGATQSP